MIAKYNLFAGQNLERLAALSDGLFSFAMTLLVLEQRRFNGLLDEMPTLGRKLLVAMSQRLREADARALN